MFFLFIESNMLFYFFFFFQAEDGIRDGHVTGVQTCALPISFWGAGNKSPDWTAGAWALVLYSVHAFPRRRTGRKPREVPLGTGRRQLALPVKSNHDGACP